MISLSLPLSSEKFPFATLGLAFFTQAHLQILIKFDPSVLDAVLIVDGRILAQENEILQVLASSLPPSRDSSLPVVSTLCDEQEQLQKQLHNLDAHLAFRTFFSGSDITLGDWMIWGALRGCLRALGMTKNGKFPHLLRWFSFIESLGATVKALNELSKARRTVANANADGHAASFDLYLTNVVQGNVVTRFPPESSGYLHIGHIKAAILNDYFARRYDGRLIIRFDDTNPIREKEEYEEAILADLDKLGIHGDTISHSSDYFPQLYDFAIQLISNGKAYVDDTEKDQMNYERRLGLASANRDRSIDENLALFEAMKSGTALGLRPCLRAKISIDNPNKAMRDPVIYRCIDALHPRTGCAWKIFPTYDFSCPIIDSLEGVTHALRSNEYRDRNVTYQWMLDSLGLRSVHVWDFSRLNFVYTPLSKRVLRECIENGLAFGWDDPRFPTLRGIRRRGMTVEALRQFILAQGPSQNQILLEWDSIWAMNKKIIDPIAPRFSAILSKDMVRVFIRDVDGCNTKLVPKHKKEPKLGYRRIVLSSNIIIEQDDAKLLSLGEEIVLMNWGTAVITSIRKNDSNMVAKLELELRPEGDIKRSRKVTCLPEPDEPLPANDSDHPVVPVVLLDYGYLITRPSLKKGDKISDYANPRSEYREAAWAEAGIATLRKGDIIQLERKGYYAVDSDFDPTLKSSMQLIRVPDGKASSLAFK